VAGQSLTKEEHFQRHKDTKISANENKNKRKNTNLSKEKLKKAKEKPADNTRKCIYMY
jgi:hypothetical protein